MPSFIMETGLATRILSHREIMISLAGLCIVLLTLLLGRVNSAVVLLSGTSESWSFPDMEAAFAPHVPAAGIVGVLYASNPLDACSPLVNVSGPGQTLVPAFLLVERGICNFEVKVRNAQEAGFLAVIIYDNQDNHELVTMSGDPSNIHAYAVFVSRFSGEFLLKYAGDMGATCYIMPAFENTAWSVMAVSFISLLAISSVLATFFFVRQHRLRRLSARFLPREPAGMSVKEVNSLPSLVFKGIEDGKGTSETCAICLEDYIPKEKLRLLPCQHEFHLDCVDQWLTTRKPFCPVCKRDAQPKVDELVATETTPLLAAVGRASVGGGGGGIRVGTTIASAHTPPLFMPTEDISPDDTPYPRIFSLSYPDSSEDLC